MKTKLTSISSAYSFSSSLIARLLALHYCDFENWYICSNFIFLNFITEKFFETIRNWLLCWGLETMARRLLDLDCWIIIAFVYINMSSNSIATIGGVRRKICLVALEMSEFFSFSLAIIYSKIFFLLHIHWIAPQFGMGTVSANAVEKRWIFWRKIGVRLRSRK